MIATWNVEYGLGPELNRRRRALLDEIAADVWVLTEIHSSLTPGDQYLPAASSQRQGPGRVSPRSSWATVRVRRELQPKAVQTSDSVRTAACLVNSDDANLLVFGTVFPWIGDQERPDFVTEMNAQRDDWMRLGEENHAELGAAGDFNVYLVPRPATVARLTSSRRARPCALQFRQMM